MKSKRLIGWALFYIAIWMVLTEFALSSLVFGLLAISIAIVLRWEWQDTVGQHKFRLQILEWLVFIGFFLWQSLRGGIATARLAIQKQPLQNDGFVNYHSQLPEGSALVWLVQLISLLPGTLCANLKGRDIEVHVLDLKRDTLGDLAECERRIQRLLRLEAPT